MGKTHCNKHTRTAEQARAKSDRPHLLHCFWNKQFSHVEDDKRTASLLRRCIVFTASPVRFMLILVITSTSSRQRAEASWKNSEHTFCISSAVLQAATCCGSAMLAASRRFRKSPHSLVEAATPSRSLPFMSATKATEGCAIVASVPAHLKDSQEAANQIQSRHAQDRCMPIRRSR